MHYLQQLSYYIDELLFFIYYVKRINPKYYPVRPPKVYSIDEHRIPAYRIDKQAFYVIEKLRTNGFIAFLVGGSVRDLLLNSRPKDFDISTSAKPEDIKKIFKRNCILIGKRFRLAHIRFGRKIIEVATFRTGESGATLILRDNIWGSPEKDVIRRDFTINGLFYDPEVQTIIDYVGGFEDLEKKILRTIGDPKIRYIQDPVRMIRLIKFKARLNFEIEKETFQAMLDNRHEILKSSPARILEELFKMLEGGFSKNFFYLLNKYEFLHLLMPSFSSFINFNPNIFSLLETVDKYNKKNHPVPLERSILVSALLFHVLENRLVTTYMQKNKFLHLGIIAIEAKKIIEEVFSHFFHLPKKLKAQIISILTNQFRIMPLTKVKKRSFKIPKDPFFRLSLQFFNLRCSQNSQLTKIYTQWNEKLVRSHKNYV